jgi:hypothetical protein
MTVGIPAKPLTAMPGGVSQILLNDLLQVEQRARCLARVLCADIRDRRRRSEADK